MLVFEDRAKQRGRDPRHPHDLVVEDDVCGGVPRAGYECAGPERRTRLTSRRRVQDLVEDREEEWGGGMSLRCTFSPESLIQASRSSKQIVQGSVKKA